MSSICSDKQRSPYGEILLAFAFVVCWLTATIGVIAIMPRPTSYAVEVLLKDGQTICAKTIALSAAEAAQRFSTGPDGFVVIMNGRETFMIPIDEIFKVTARESETTP